MTEGGDTTPKELEPSVSDEDGGVRVNCQGGSEKEGVASNNNTQSKEVSQDSKDGPRPTEEDMASETTATTTCPPPGAP